jgi:hypothetical protein
MKAIVKDRTIRFYPEWTLKLEGRRSARLVKSREDGRRLPSRQDYSASEAVEECRAPRRSARSFITAKKTGTKIRT